MTIGNNAWTYKFGRARVESSSSLSAAAFNDTFDLDKEPGQSWRAASINGFYVTNSFHVSNP
jgi:hypothetical protein